MLAGSMFSAIPSHAPLLSCCELLLGSVEPSRHRAVEDLVADPRHDAADDGGIDDHLDVHRAPRGLRQRLGEPLTLSVVERHGAANLGQRMVAFAGCPFGQRLNDVRELARPSASITNPSRFTVTGFARSPRSSATRAFLFSAGNAASVSASRSGVFCSRAFAKP